MRADQGRRAMAQRTAGRRKADAAWTEVDSQRFIDDGAVALPSPLRAVLASLVVHHLPAAGKRRLFADLARRLEPGGALLLADVVEPASPAARDAFARQWADAARAQSLALTGGLEAFERFE